MLPKRDAAEAMQSSAPCSMPLRPPTRRKYFAVNHWVPSQQAIRLVLISRMPGGSPDLPPQVEATVTLARVRSMENRSSAFTACANPGGMYSRSPAFNSRGFPASVNSQRPLRIWTSA